MIHNIYLPFFLFYHHFDRWHDCSSTPPSIHPLLFQDLWRIQCGCTCRGIGYIRRSHSTYGKYLYSRYSTRYLFMSPYVMSCTWYLYKSPCMTSCMWRAYQCVPMWEVYQDYQLFSYENARPLPLLPLSLCLLSSSSILLLLSQTLIKLVLYSD